MPVNRRRLLELAAERLEAERQRIDKELARSGPNWRARKLSPRPRPRPKQRHPHVSGKVANYQPKSAKLNQIG